MDRALSWLRFGVIVLGLAAAPLMIGGCEEDAGDEVEDAAEEVEDAAD